VWAPSCGRAYRNHFVRMDTAPPKPGVATLTCRIARDNRLSALLGIMVDVDDAYHLNTRGASGTPSHFAERRKCSSIAGCLIIQTPSPREPADTTGHSRRIACAPLGKSANIGVITQVNLTQSVPSDDCSSSFVAYRPAARDRHQPPITRRDAELAKPGPVNRQTPRCTDSSGTAADADRLARHFASTFPTSTTRQMSRTPPSLMNIRSTRS
jgi:hypothetical protein